MSGSAVTDFVDFTGLLTCFFGFALRTVFFYCVLVLLCAMCCLRAYYDDKCKKLNSLKHLVRTTVAGSHN